MLSRSESNQGFTMEGVIYPFFMQAVKSALTSSEPQYGPDLVQKSSEGCSGDSMFTPNALCDNSQLGRCLPGALPLSNEALLLITQQTGMVV